MKSNPVMSMSLRCVLAVSLLGCLALFGAWRVHSTLASVDRLTQTAEHSSQQFTESADGQLLANHEQRLREVQELRCQAWWTVAVMVVGAAVIVGRLLTITSIVGHESSEWETLEKRLREREARLQAILDSEPECVKLIASDGTLLEMNAAGLEMIEVGSASQIVGQRVESLVAPEYRSDFHSLSERVFRGEAGTLEYEIIGLKGGRRWLDTHASPLRDDRGLVIALLGITRDITPRKQAEEALRQANAQLTATLDALPDLMFEVDATGRVFDFRAPQIDRMFVSPPQFLGKRMCEVLPADAAEIIDGAIEEANSIGMHQGATYSLDLQRGKSWFELSIARKGQSLGDNSRFVLLARDITDRIRIEQELRASQASLEEAQAIASLGSWKFDTDRRVGTWSSEMFRLFDRDPNQGTPSFENYLETIHPEDRHLLPEANARAIETDERPEIVYRTNPACGPLRYLSGRVQANRDPHGRVIQLSGTLWDVTQLKQAGEALRESEERFRVLIDQAADSMFVHDFEGKLLDVNRSACESLGYSREELLKLPVTAFETGVSLAALQEKWNGLQAGVPFTVNGRHRRQDGSEFPVEVRVGLIESGGACVIMALVRNISERKQTEEALRASDARLRMLVDQMPAALWAVDREMQITSSTGAALKQLGLRPGQLVGMSLFEYLQSEDPDLLPIASHRRALAGETVEYESQWAGRMFATHIEPLRDTAEKITGALGLSFDITERVRTEKALHESDAQYRLLADNTDDFVELLDLEGSRLYLSPSYLRATGWTLEEIQNSDWRNRMNADDLPLLERTRSTALAGETSLTEHRIRRKDDSWIWVELRFKPILDQDGRVFQILQVSRDITERKRAESALRESEAMLELILDSIPQGVFWKNRQSVYLGANRVARLAMGLTDPHTVPGLTDFDVPTFQPEEAEFFVSKDREVMNSDQPQFAIVESMTLPDGSTNWIETNKLPMYDADGNVCGLLGTWENITERKLAKEELQSSRERLAMLSRQLIAAQESERRDVARELHDEIGQVLTAVGLNLHHLKAVCGVDANAELDAGLNLINQAMTQVRELSLNLRPPMLDVLGLDAAVRSCVEQHRKQTGCDVQLDLQLETRLSPELEITCYRVVQSALTNIARHARASQVLVELRQNELGLELVVRDNGVGFDLESIRQRSDQGESFGLLAMQERVHLVGGTLRIDSASTPEAGTSIHAHLPFVTTSASKEAFA